MAACAKFFAAKFYVGDNPDTLAGAQIIGGIIDQSAPDINKLEVPYQLAFSAMPHRHRRKGQTVCVC